MYIAPSVHAFFRQFYYDINLMELLSTIKFYYVFSGDPPTGIWSALCTKFIARH